MSNHSYRIPPGTKVRLQDFSPDDTGPFKKKADAAGKLESDVARLNELQYLLSAQNAHALLVILQGIDAAGKDGLIRHVMSGMNPTHCRVKSFKAPSEEELDHDYLWRCTRALPERGTIGIFNRSYYEEVLVVRVHTDLLKRQRIAFPKDLNDLWRQRYRDINHFEQYLVDNGVTVLKFFLNLSKDEQKKRFLERLDVPEKNWKFSAADVHERKYWDDYQAAFADMLSHTSTEHAPWYCVPADSKWFTRAVVAETIVKTLEGMKLEYPKLNAEQKQALTEARKILEGE